MGTTSDGFVAGRGDLETDGRPSDGGATTRACVAQGKPLGLSLLEREASKARMLETLGAVSVHATSSVRLLVPGLPAVLVVEGLFSCCVGVISR